MPCDYSWWHAGILVPDPSLISGTSREIKESRWTRGIPHGFLALDFFSDLPLLMGRAVMPSSRPGGLGHRRLQELSFSWLAGWVTVIHPRHRPPLFLANAIGACPVGFRSIPPERPHWAGRTITRPPPVACLLVLSETRDSPPPLAALLSFLLAGENPEISDH